MAVSSAAVWDLRAASLVEYDMTSAFDPKSAAMQSSTPRIESSALEPASKTFEFSVPNMIGQRSIDAAGDTNLVWAFKASGGWGKHSDKAYSTLNLATGVATPPVLNPVKVLHIVCMSLAWGLFLPLGIVQSMAFKRGPCSSCGPWWFIAHIVLNVIGLGTMLFGGLFALIIVPDGTHFTDPCVGPASTADRARAARLCLPPAPSPSVLARAPLAALRLFPRALSASAAASPSRLTRACAPVPPSRALTHRRRSPPAGTTSWVAS
jgi:hypothetical protein